jgi:hypothetical protein
MQPRLKPSNDVPASGAVQWRPGPAAQGRRSPTTNNGVDVAQTYRDSGMTTLWHAARTKSAIVLLCADQCCACLTIPYEQIQCGVKHDVFGERLHQCIW